ncbi:16S rRNA (guanine(527)-N(7))-methyltransferase RsmG [bacterium]|nr:16S rRNA (guanine(527)-N(7))-methyltransferase RsmG [bacterium]
MRIEKLFLESLNSLGIELSKDKVKKFNIYYNQIIFWNEKINITALKDKEDIYIKHFVDSLSIVKAINFSKQSVVDIGTGAGLPGLPLRIVYPELSVTFIDSSKKKIMVLNSILEELDIKDCCLIDNNVENVGRDPKHRERYDIVLSRALGEFNLVSELGIPLLKTSGMLVQYKGPNVDKEVENSLKALHVLSSKIKNSIEFKLPFSNIKRAIVVVEKTQQTEDKYPRKVGIPKKKPLQG